MNVMRFYRFSADGRLEIAKVRITQKKREKYKPRDRRPPNRHEAIARMSFLGFFRTLELAQGFRRRTLAQAVRRAFSI